MRANKLWRTYKTIHLERALMTVPRGDRRVLRGYVAGKRFQ
jgi:hypothetical protein